MDYQGEKNIGAYQRKIKEKLTIEVSLGVKGDFSKYICYLVGSGRGYDFSRMEGAMMGCSK